jgi:hypothetical protein
MEVSGQLHALTILPSGKELGRPRFRCRRCWRHMYLHFMHICKECLNEEYERQYFHAYVCVGEFCFCVYVCVFSPTFPVWLRCTRMRVCFHFLVYRVTQEVTF